MAIALLHNLSAASINDTKLLVLGRSGKVGSGPVEAERVDGIGVARNLDNRLASANVPSIDLNNIQIIT